MSLPSTLSNPWATQFRASLFADEDSPLDALGEAVESLGFGWLEGYMAQIFESGEACEGEGESHDEEHVPALGDLIKTPSRKKGTTAKKTRAKAAADKDKVNKLAALNKKNASDDQPIARSKGDLFAPITLASPLPSSSSATSAPTSTAAITIATVASHTSSRARAVKLVAASPAHKPLSPSKHPLPSFVATSPFRPPLSPHNSSHTNVLRAVSPLANRSSAKGEENASSLIQQLVGSPKKGGEHDEREEQEDAEREVVVPVVKKKADMKASKAKAGGKKTKEKIAVQEEKEEGRGPEELAIVDTPEMEESVPQQPEGEMDQRDEEEILQGPADSKILKTPSAAPVPPELQPNQQPAQSTNISTYEFSPPSPALQPIEEPQVAPFSLLSKPVVQQELARHDASNAGELEEKVEEREEEAASPVEPEAIPLQPELTDVQAEAEVNEEEMEDGEIVESTLDEIDSTDEEDTLEAPRPDTSLATEPEEEEEIEAEDQEFAAPRSPVKPLSSSSSLTATKMPTPVPFPIASSSFAPKQKEELIQREDGEVDVQLGEEQEDVELSQQEQVDEEEEEVIPADEEADISANRSQSPVILDEEALLKEEAEKGALAAADLVSSVSVKALDETTDLAHSIACNASETLSTTDLANSQTKQPEYVGIPLSQPAELASLTTSTSSAASDHPVQPAAQPTPPQPVKPARPVRSSWLNKALGGGAAASSADSADQPGGLRKSHGATLVAASREREKEHQLQAAASSASASSSMMPPPRLSTALKRKSGEGIDAPAGEVDLDAARSNKFPKLSDPASHPLSVTLPKTNNSRSTILFSPPPAATASLHADNQNGIDRVRKAVEELSAKAARSKGLSSMGPGGFGGSAAQLPYIPRDSSVPASRLPGVGVPATTAAAIVAEAAAAKVITPQEAVAIESELQVVASPPLIDAHANRMDDAEDYMEEQLPSLPSLPTSPRRSSNADENDYPEESSAFPSSLASLVDQIDDQLAEAFPPPAPAPVAVKKQPTKNLSPPVSRARTPPPPAVAADEIPLGSTTPAASPPPAPLVAATIPKSSKVANLAQSFAGPSSTVEKGDLTLEDLEVPPKKTANKKAAVVSGGKGKGKKVDEDDLHDVQMEGEEEELVEVEDPKPQTTRVTRAGLNSSLSQSTSNGLASSTSNARLGASTSGQPSIYAQGSTFAAKALGKSAKAGPVKSLQLAAEAQKKEVAQKERKAAMSKLAEAQRMRALAEKQKEEKDRAEEEKRQRNAELAERKARAAELEKKRRDREEKERKAKELSKSQAAPDDDNSKKRKVAPDTTSKSANDPKRFASSTSSKPQPSAVKQLAKPPASAGLPAKVVVPSFRHLPPQTANATASSSTSSSNQQQQRSSIVLASSTIRMVGGGLGPPVRPSEVGKMSHQQQQQQQQHRPSQAQGASVLAAQRQMLQNHINAQNEEVPGQSEAIELPDIKSEYSDSDDEDRPKSSAPQWAQSPEIRSALREQELHNPDEIFGPMRPLNMEETFRARAGKFRARSSSANWGGQDRLTPQEELEYARRMGFVSQAAQSGLRQAD